MTSRRSADAMGLVGALVYLAFVVVAVSIPMLLIPLALCHVFEECQLTFRWTIGTIVLTSIGFFVLAVGVSLFMGLLVRAVPRLGHPAINGAVKGLVEVGLLWWFYGLLIEPSGHALLASVVLTVFCLVTEPILDRALDRQRRGGVGPSDT
ncbi:hypothetical protein [Acidipropionibacterium timonense]|uniref:hypothetical protein n=1 Tax=Acidipropionibacterium timonense TaxID=2161818 RepID=UPI00103032B6|nr:hypothetical protein [Acidipropionibacterium timonense]